MPKPQNQHEVNLQIEALLKQKKVNNESYSQAEKAFLNQYEGSGGQAKNGARGVEILYEFYTPSEICMLMWELAYVHGFPKMGSSKTGKVLEPSMGTGRLIADAPDKAKVTGFEINPITAEIAKILFPEATIHNEYFETAFLQPDRFTTKIKGSTPTWLKDYPFDLVIGNPPYGKYANRYSSFFSKPKFLQIEMFFIYKGLEVLKKDGLLIYLTAQNFMRTGGSSPYQSAKEIIGKIATLEDAYRLPKVFLSSDVPTDILIFRKL